MASEQGTFDTAQSKDLDLEKLTSIMQDLGAASIYLKKLAPNDNSKNQPYFGSHLTDLPFIPTGDIIASDSDSKKKADKRKIKYQASLDLAWVGADGTTYKAPHAKLIYYPQYPEVRFSGFLKGSKVSASEWMSPDKQGRCEGRWLVLGVTTNQTIYAYLVTPECSLSRELETVDFIEISTVFRQLDTRHAGQGLCARDTLCQKLLGIHQMGWIPSQKLGTDMVAKSYKAPNGGGYTLESMLGVSPNGVAEPDYLGYEVKQFGVTRFPRTGSKPTTLMTPEPNGGYYISAGAMEFVRNYGYDDKNGKPDRLNFGGKHVVGTPHDLTKLTMRLIGFDAVTASITDASGSIALLDDVGTVAASWSFAKFMDHWKRKHAKAVYIPCIRRTQLGMPEYFYGKDVELGIGTSFEMILHAMSMGAVYYDPGIKLEKASSDKPSLKRRSQFRVNHKHLDTLYRQYEFLDLTS